MAILSVVLYRPTPGRREEAEKAVREARELHTSLGAKVRAWKVGSAGPNSGTISYGMEFADYHAYQDYVDKLQAQPKRPLQAAMDNGALTLVSASRASEIV